MGGVIVPASKQQASRHLAIASLRAVGLPARYASGYLITRPPPGQATQGRGRFARVASIWSMDAGRIDFEPTNGTIPAGEHITLAYGRDYGGNYPVSGVLLRGGDQTMSVAVDVDQV